jgi:hypothetical protein
MSICIYPVNPEQLRARIAPAVQRQPLAPFPDRLRGPGYWQLNRDPMRFRQLTEEGWTRRLELGEDLGEQPGTEGAQAGAPSTAPRASTAARAGAPETLGWTWHVAGLTASPQEIPCASTPAIPWPFRVVGFDLHEGINVVDDTYVWNIFAASQPYTDTIPAYGAGSPLLTLIESGAANDVDFSWGGLFTYAAGIQSIPQKSIASAVLGRTVQQAGQYLVIAIRGVNTGFANFSGTLTVERWDASTVLAPRPTSAPVDIMPPPARPAAQPCQPPAYGSLDYWRNQLAIAQRMPPTSYWTPIKEQAQRAIECLERQQRSRTGLDVLPVTTAQNATDIAARLREQGETARAAIYADMARRMERGYALTPAQEALLSNPTVYRPTVIGITPPAQ